MINKMALALLLGTTSTCALAQSNSTTAINPGYSQDSRGNVTRSEFGLCWRSGSWTPGNAMVGCDGPLAPPVPNPIAPAFVSPPDKENATAIARCDFSTTLESDQTFAFGQAKLNELARQHINNDVISKLTNCKSVESITITGHTDPIGSVQGNERLSQQRATAVADFLRQHKITAPIHTIGAGSTESASRCPVSLNKAKRIACFAPDRRVTIIVNGPKK